MAEAPPAAKAPRPGLGRRFRNQVRNGLLRAPALFNAANRVRNLGIDALIATFPARYIGKTIGAAEAAALPGGGVRNLQMLHPAERVQIGSGAPDRFFEVAQYHREGWFQRADIFVCEIPNAHVHVRSGMVCTRDFEVLVDEGLEHRHLLYQPFRKRRPQQVRKVAGLWATLAYCNAENFWHWMIDCLPKLQTLERAAAGRTVTLFMPQTALGFQRYTLEALLPANFRLEYLDSNVDVWLQPECLLWSTLLSGLCIGQLPAGYIDGIRQPIFRRIGLPASHTKSERIYVSRRNAGHRRVRNEDALCELLSAYGFRSVQLEKLPFEQQVSLFHSAEIVVGAHGAGLGTILFSGDIDVVALYSTANPGNYFHSLAVGLGQRHHFVCEDEAHEDNWFDADLAAIKSILENDLHLSPIPPEIQQGSQGRGSLGSSE